MGTFSQFETNSGFKILTIDQHFSTHALRPLTWLLELVGHDAADKVGSSASQGAHQLVQLFLSCMNHLKDTCEIVSAPRQLQCS